MKKNIGTTIKKYRLMKNKTQIQLAQDVEISAPGLAAYESGKRILCGYRYAGVLECHETVFRRSGDGSGLCGSGRRGRSPV